MLIANTDSLAEQIQREFPTARVVKTLNTMNCELMIDPASVAHGQHTVFVSGDDLLAKQTVTDLLHGFGWTDILDLGDIHTARGPEMFFALWIRTFAVLGTPAFQIAVVRN